jgi:hypothetical protein
MTAQSPRGEPLVRLNGKRKEAVEIVDGGVLGEK